MKNHEICFVLFFCLCPLFTLANDPSQKLSCSGIESFDIQNSSISLDTSLAPLQFINGKSRPLEEVSQVCEWEYAITTDRIIRPDTLFPVRVVIINSNHLTGSGFV
jgi:hypothetical protein